MEGMQMNTTKLLRHAGALLVLAAGLFGAQAALADGAEETFEVSASNLLVVLRESPGVNKQEESLQPFGKISAKLPDGRVIEFEASWFQYLGDMHLRLVFDGIQHVQSALPGDLKLLKLSPEEALARAVDNLRTRYGIPVIEPWTGGLMMVHGNAPDLDSSYFLDRQFWLDTARDYPEGIVAAVPRSGGLVFARADDEEALNSLRFSAAALYAANDRIRVSSALYLFKDGRWSVFQPPQQPAD
jgi:hypothetical protein